MSIDLATQWANIWLAFIKICATFSDIKLSLYLPRGIWKKYKTDKFEVKFSSPEMMNDPLYQIGNCSCKMKHLYKVRSTIFGLYLGSVLYLKVYLEWRKLRNRFPMW